MDYYVYILQSQKDQRFYKGQTNNLQKRFQEHNQGKSNYTRNFIPWKLFAYKICETRRDAMRLEKKLKNLKSTKKLLEFINKNKFIFPDSQEVIGPEN